MSETEGVLESMNEGGEYQERGLKGWETLQGTSGVQCGGPEVCVGRNVLGVAGEV